MFVSTYFDQNYVLNVVLKYFTSCGEFMIIGFVLAKTSQFQQIRFWHPKHSGTWTAALSLTQRCPRPNTYWYLEYMNIMPGLCWLNNKYKILYRVSWRLCQLAEFGLSICQHIMLAVFYFFWSFNLELNHIWKFQYQFFPSHQ